ncbi:hypothetical protein [Robbsia sp. KACC 23696]|uniref:hypothetical protein n=1 Tax=Robbsia sp. KACC 23696 TaxID=3149231 RepID=UPI00325AEC9C
MTPIDAMKWFSEAEGAPSFGSESESDALRLATWLALNLEKLNDNDVSVMIRVGAAVLAYEDEAAWGRYRERPALPLVASERRSAARRRLPLPQ